MKRIGYLGLALPLALTESACVVVGGYGRRGGWFIWPGGLGGLLIIVVLIMLLRRR